MIKLLLLLLLSIPAYSHHIIGAKHLSGEEICAAIEDEIDHAVEQGLLTSDEAFPIIVRCYQNYG